jgi:hypothetical protein
MEQDDPDTPDPEQPEQPDHTDSVLDPHVICVRRHDEDDALLGTQWILILSDSNSYMSTDLSVTLDETI